MENITKSLTVGVIAEKLECPLHQVMYLIKTRNVQPVARAGNCRVFSPEVIPLLRKELTMLGKRKSLNHVCQTS